MIASSKLFRMEIGDAQRCPTCDQSLTAESVNIKEGVALCPKCGKLSRLSELSSNSRSRVEILKIAPGGCSVEPRGQSVVVRASLRSAGGFAGAAFMALFWNGIVSVFVLIAVAGLYANLIGPLPDWFPAPGVNDGKPQMNDAPMNLGMTLFLCVFLIPFVTVGAVLAGATLVYLIGKVEVVVDEFHSYVATGIGVFAWRKRFDARQVQAIRENANCNRSNNESNKQIEIVADRIVAFGTLLSADRFEWIRAVLQQLLLPASSERIGGELPRPRWIPRRHN